MPNIPHTHLPRISMYTTAGVDFSTTSAIKLYLKRGLSGLKGAAQCADGRMNSRHCRDIDTRRFFALSLSRKATPHSPRLSRSGLENEELWWSSSLLLFLSVEGTWRSGLGCPPTFLWFRVAADGKRLTVLIAWEFMPRLWHRACVLSVKRKHFFTIVAAMLHHFGDTDLKVSRQRITTYIYIF